MRGFRRPGGRSRPVRTAGGSGQRGPGFRRAVIGSAMLAGQASPNDSPQEVAYDAASLSLAASVAASPPPPACAPGLHPEHPALQRLPQPHRVDQRLELDLLGRGRDRGQVLRRRRAPLHRDQRRCATRSKADGGNVLCSTPATSSRARCSSPPTTARPRPSAEPHRPRRHGLRQPRVRPRARPLAKFVEAAEFPVLSGNVDVTGDNLLAPLALKTPRPRLSAARRWRSSAPPPQRPPRSRRPARR